MKLVCASILCVLSFWLPALANGANDGPHIPGSRDKCPVCGMFVAKYPDWVASISIKNERDIFFDGPKDMFTYYLNRQKYNPAGSKNSVSGVHVKDYYTLRQIDGFTAYYVVGSNVFGPMGKELIPFKNVGDAKGFLRDHGGKMILRFNQITPDTLKMVQ